jgi:hypothetical protein
MPDKQSGDRKIACLLANGFEDSEFRVPYDRLHRPQLLLTAELQRGRTLTPWKTVQDDLRQAGATVLDQGVVVDDNWLTSRQPADLEAFSASPRGARRARSARRVPPAGGTVDLAAGLSDACFADPETVRPQRRRGACRERASRPTCAEDRADRIRAAGAHL